MDNHGSLWFHHATVALGSDTPQVPVIEMTNQQAGALSSQNSTYTACKNLVKGGQSEHYDPEATR